MFTTEDSISIITRLLAEFRDENCFVSLSSIDDKNNVIVQFIISQDIVATRSGLAVKYNNCFIVNFYSSILTKF
jgi:hypothetical protein